MFTPMVTDSAKLPENISAVSARGMIWQRSELLTIALKKQEGETDRERERLCGPQYFKFLDEDNLTGK